MEGQLGGNQQCMKCAHEEEVAAGNKPFLLPKIYHCPVCHKDYENAHGYSGHFKGGHKRERMNLMLSSTTQMKRKEQVADLKSEKVEVEQEFSKRTPTRKDEASCSRDTPYNQPCPRLPMSPTCGSVSQSLGNQMHSGNVGNLTRGSPNRSLDTVMHPRNIGNTSHGSINRSMEAVPMPSRNVCNHPAARHNPLQGSQSGRVRWAQPIVPMSHGPVQAQFGRAGWPRPSSIGSYVSQRPVQGNQSDYVHWGRHFGVNPMASVPLQAGCQSGYVGRERHFGNPTPGLAQGSQFGHVQRARPIGQPMSYGPSRGPQSGHFRLPRPNHMNHGPAPGSQSEWQRPFRNSNPMVSGPLQGSHQNGSVGWPRPTQIGNPVFNGPSQGSLQYIQQDGWARHANPIYVNCKITSRVGTNGSHVQNHIDLNTDPGNLSTGENITSTEGGTSRRPPEGGHEGEMKAREEEEEELDLTLRL
ncbi:hypothetical protein FRX31_022825 [Thalictrum thalictroides]|uniref:C2H2-type domain-containing protein n=1 Tax=Thalictrum thalictroides TaxID=46969 RepID=A0A7J6VSP5_THATH|nr:hypothetical protein FRX31_022825 [Thalictrum thalictroides]